MQSLSQHFRASALTLVMFIMAVSPAYAAIAKRITSDEPLIRSGSALVMDEQSSEVLYSRESNIAAPIASISKLMTALVVLEAKQDPDEIIKITDDDLDYEKNTRSRLRVGTKLSRDDLLHLALMSSENRAAYALARNYPGGVVECVRAMNKKARELGMKNTHFVEPTGLSSDNMASPDDLAKLVMAASQNDVIAEYSTDEYHSLKVGRQSMTFHNTNLLVRKSDWDIIVQKTGYIAEAGKCLVMKAVIAGRTVVIVLLDSVGKYTRVADAQRIRKWMEAKIRNSLRLTSAASALPSGSVQSAVSFSPAR